MRPVPRPNVSHVPRRVAAHGFTLFETIIVIGLLTLVSLGLMAMQPQIFKAQTASRDEYVGDELMQACAERVLAVRRAVGYASVSTSTCAVLGSVAGLTPSVALEVDGAASSPCGGSTCKATIKVLKAGVAAALPALTLELKSY